MIKISFTNGTVVVCRRAVFTHKGLAFWRPEDGDRETLVHYVDVQNIEPADSEETHAAEEAACDSATQTDEAVAAEAAEWEAIDAAQCRYWSGLRPVADGVDLG